MIYLLHRGKFENLSTPFRVACFYLQSRSKAQRHFYGIVIVKTSYLKMKKKCLHFFEGNIYISLSI